MMLFERLSLSFPYFSISHALHIARQSWLGARGCIHHTVKDTNVQKNTFKKNGKASGGEVLHSLC